MSNPVFPFVIRGERGKRDKKPEKPSLLDRIRRRKAPQSLNAEPANPGQEQPMQSNSGTSNTTGEQNTRSRTSEASSGNPNPEDANHATPSIGAASAGIIVSQADHIALPQDLLVLVPNSDPLVPPLVDNFMPRNLWSEAFTKLSLKEQEHLQMLQPTVSKDAVDNLLVLTKQVQKEGEERSLKVSFGGKDIFMRDVAGKIICWLTKFKEIGDIAVNFDPVHAALPWAGVRFLLQAVLAEHEQMGDLAIATEMLSYLIQRGAVYERLYQPETIPEEDVVDNLYAAMVELYAAMLRMISLCHRLFDKNTTKRSMHALFKPGDVSAAIDKCQALEERVEHEAQNCERARSQTADAETKRLLLLLQDPVLRTNEHVLSLSEKAAEQERLKILDWFSGVLYGKNHETVTEKRTADTCEWLLSHENYQEWQNSAASIVLWLCGNPGTGKTFLVSKVIDEIQIVPESNDIERGLAFFYCNRNEAERRQPLSVLRAFVRQLSTDIMKTTHPLSPQKPVSNEMELMQKTLKQFYNDSRVKATEPMIGDCKNLLLQLVNAHSQTTLVLDALDECETHSRTEILELFDCLLANASKPLRIFISSRPELDIRRKLKDRTTISINAKSNDQDINRFVNSQITKHSNWYAMSSELRAKIVNILQEKSQGMFQWVFLQIKQLLDLDLEEDILDALGKLPEDLKHAYDEIYRAMTNAEKRIADRAFQWVMCACEPLTTYELLPAIAQDPNIDVLKPLGGLTEDLVLKYCHNLLVIDPVRKVWVPSHLSVLEYFENNLWSQTQANYLVANVCLLVLQNTIFYNREQAWRIFDDEFLNIKYSWDDYTSVQPLDSIDPLQNQGFKNFSLYIRHHWPIHASRSSDIDKRDRLIVRLEKFLGLPTESSAAYQCWYRMIECDYRFVQLSTSVFNNRIQYKDMAPASVSSFAYCAFGLATLLPKWHNLDWVQEDRRNETNRTFLELAALSGSTFTCRCLIEHGAEVNAQTESYQGSALAAAVEYGEREMIEFLIEKGAEVDMQLNRQLGSVLAIAAFHGQRGIVEFLIEKGAQVDMQLEHGRCGSALATAAYSGERGIVEFLIEKGAQVDMQLEYGRWGSTLAIAAYYRQRDIVECLVEKGAQVDVQLKYGQFGSALIAAVPSGRVDIIEFLLNEGGADVNLELQYGEYRSALDTAEKWESQETTEVLLKHGAKRKEQQSRLVDETEVWESEDGWEEEVEIDEIAEEASNELEEEETNSNEGK